MPESPNRQARRRLRQEGYADSRRHLVVLHEGWCRLAGHVARTVA